MPQPRIDDARAALLVVDVHQFTVSREHGFARLARERGITGELDEYFDQVTQVLPNIGRLVDGWRRRGAPVIFTRLVAAAGDAVTPQARVTGFWAPAEAVEAGFLPDLAPAAGDAVIDKTANSAAAGGALSRAMLLCGAATLVVCGVQAHGAVELTARDAADLGVGVIVVPDACAAETWAHHTFAMATLVGGLIRVRSTTEVLAMLAGSSG